MKIKVSSQTVFSVFLLAFLYFLVVQHSSGQTTTRKFYKYDVIATTNSNLDVFAAPSINDYGDVAFAGRKTPGGGTVFLSEIGQPAIDLMPNLSTSSNQFVAGRVQINNLQQVIQHTFVSGTTPSQNFLRRINGVNNFTLIAAANGTGGFNDFDQIWSGSTSINNNGESVFLTRQGSNTTILTTGERPNFSTLQFPSTGNSQNPMISDLGCIVTRAGANATDPLRLYTYGLSEFETIASVADGFTAIGQSPALSDSCEVIVFYGNLNATGAQTLATNPGPGIFASIETGKKQRRIVRIAGRLIEDTSAPGGNDDGYCDPGETCIQGELGFNQSGNPIFFSSLDTFSRVAVAHQSFGAAGIEDDIFVVSFLGTPNIGNDRPERPFSNQLGLWTLTTQIKNENGVLREKPLIAVPVVQIGDVINNRTVTAINVYDQVANVRVPSQVRQISSDPIPGLESLGDHRLAFHVATNNGNMIIRAERTVETPVIFIPGIMGSRLAENSNGQLSEKWIGLGLGLLTGANFDRLIPSQNADIAATDVIRDVLNVGGTSLLGEVYKPLLQTLTSTGGLREYQVENKPERRTNQGCDMNQRFNDPTLFVFAYDWRKTNIENSDNLKDYVRCIQKFYPGAKVDIVAHSMGGLLARRYIISNSNDHSVRKLITVGSPFLGAPRALETIETGRLRLNLPDFIDKRIPSFVTNRVKTLARESKAVHELFPSDAYFTLGGTPFIEETFDINGDGTVPQIYNYAQTKNFYNARFPNLPYSTNENFHSFPGQDDWRLDTSGVEYFHIFGVKRRSSTVEQVIAKPIVRKPLSVVTQDISLSVNKGFGDGTVPRLSAERCQNAGCVGGLDFNSPNATAIGFFAQTRAEDKLYEHTGLVRDADVRMEILDILNLPSQPVINSSEQQNKEKVMNNNHTKS